ncbi:hypothetical protein PMAYCL1PPCAC_27306, partial [Pristionchus mayeri]
RFTCPILILHAEDDHIIPVKLGRALKKIKNNYAQGKRDVTIPKTREFSYTFIYTEHELPEIVSKLVSR